jgi:7-carboxy-7-deazaguanine synthase
MTTPHIIDLHTCIQGEGALAGVPHILIRTAGCNLRCAFQTSICDTPYSSYAPEESKYTTDNIKSLIEDNPQIMHLMITGGEPMLHPAFIEFICDEYGDTHYITVETNGTFMPSERLLKLVDLWSISPKLASQLLTAEKAAQFNLPFVERKPFNNILPARNVIATHRDYQIKYVISSVDDLLAMEEHIQLLKGVSDRRIYLMPEGDTPEKLTANRQLCAEYAIKEGYNYTDRLQFIIYGNKRDA